MKKPTERLQSLDVLRGLDLFALTILCPILHAYQRTGSYPIPQTIMNQFDHVGWEGFTCWDLVMPLFMFMAGVSIPFAFAKYRNTTDSKSFIHRKIIKRVIVLWVLGMICQGNLLSLDTSAFRLFSNTLQAIAIGYLFAAIMVLHTRKQTQLIITGSLLIGYWGLMTFVHIDGFGGGNYSAGGNLAEWVDRIVLGHWRDGAYLDKGGVIFPEWYNYTWILSSLNFIATVMTGVIAGHILRSQQSGNRKTILLLAIGAGMTAIGWLWSLEMPVIKRIWTSSMVLVSSGYCFLLMGTFYYVIDCCHFQKGWGWLKIVGMNSILAYVLSTEVGILHLNSIGESVLYGLQRFLSPEWYGFTIQVSNIALIYILLYILYRNKIFIKA